MQNFFAHQQTARRGTKRLVILFSIMMLVVIALVYFAIVGIMTFAEQRNTRGFTQKPPVQLWQPMVLVGTALGTGLLIGGGSLYKISQLASGGRPVALLLGGREILPNTSDWREKRLLNIVEEMAIASGVPVPPVFLLEEQAINAFAAGYTPGDAVIGISRGCMDYLTRDEIQGVVAHEFSHILNGDMKLNIRLMGWIHGLVFLSIVGYYLFEIALRSGSNSRDKDSKGTAFFVVLGLVIWIAGGIGSLMGQIIQAAVSRKREYLADASAVQFTRNPEGIGGALKKIGGLEYGSVIKHPEGRAVNHMFFGEGVKRMTDLLASHPPLPMRIKAIDPQWDGEYPKVKKVYGAQDPPEPKEKKDPNMIPGLPTIPGVEQVPIPVVLGLAAQTVARVGTLTTAAVEKAGQMVARIPDSLREAAEHPFSARTLIYAMLLDRDERIRSKQMQILHEIAHESDVSEMSRHLKQVVALPEDLRLPLLEIAVPALRQMSTKQYRDFREIAEKLIEADGELSLFEYAISSLLNHYLEQAFEPRRRPLERYTDIRYVLPAVRTILSRLAYEGADGNPKTSAIAYEAGANALGGSASQSIILPEEECDLASFDKALRKLRGADGKVKEQLIRAVAECILADCVVTTREQELLRVICANLDCPLPPLEGEPIALQEAE
jgi:Zn-dependent protease with chaperone function